MKRTDADLNVANLFADGDPTIPTVGTLLDASWLNNVQEELCNAVEADGSTLSGSNHAQLRQALALLLPMPGGRLSLTASTPVTTADVTGATAVKYTPYPHNRISLYNGTTWKFYTLTELSQATTDSTKSPAAVTTNSNYDVFVWDDSGTLRATRGPLWTSDTARGTGAGTTELGIQDGRLCNNVAITNGPAAKRGLYVGTIRSDGSSQINDSLAKRHVWNMYNRVRRPLKVVEATASWTYTTATFRQANAAAGNQLDFVLGLNEEPVQAEVTVLVSNDNAGVTLSSGIGLDSTSTNSADVWNGVTSAVANMRISPHARFCNFAGLGRHTLVWLEFSGVTGTSTWVSGGTGSWTSGIVGSVNG